MDFFDAQDRARRHSRWLLLWYIPMIAFLSCGFSILLKLIFIILLLIISLFIKSATTGLLALLSSNTFFITSSLMSALYLFLASWWRSGQLQRIGGSGVAHELGGYQLNYSLADSNALRLLHIVEEISIASGMRIPKVFILPQAHGINAFAAGYSPHDYVVVVTHGALQHLSRDELQALVSHEFGHLKNGDTTLNMRLLSILHGMALLFRLGEKMTEVALPARHNNQERALNHQDTGIFAAFFLFGIAMIMYALHGIWLARLAQAAVSRQREFLADANAVQFTRNPRAVAGALEKAHTFSSVIQHPHANEMAHFFCFDHANNLFDDAVGWFDRLLATHPPITERINRIDANLLGDEILYEDATPIPLDEQSLAISLVANSTDALDAPPLTILQHSRQLLHHMPPALLEDTRSVDYAEYPLYATLIARHSASRQAQYRVLANHLNKNNSLRVIRHADWMAAQKDARYRLPIFDLSLSSLQRGSQQLRHDVLRISQDLLDARADQQQLSAHILRLLLVKQLTTNDQRPQRPRPLGITALRHTLAQLFALVAHESSKDANARKDAFDEAVRHLEGRPHWPMPTLAPDADQLLTLFDNLAISNPLYRRKILEACACAALHDGIVSVREAELIRAIGQMLNAPIPLPVHYADEADISSAADTPSTA